MSSVRPTYEQIWKRAYEHWEQRGRPEGYDTEFWAQAERELKLAANLRGERTNSDAGRSGSGSDGPRDH
jgi:hypothetical protein